MNKLKLFLENLLVYGFGGLVSRVVPVIMTPIITRLMPTPEYYGISDLSNTVVQFGSAIAVMGMYDAMYRMFFERNDEDYKKSVCSITLCFTFIASFVVFLLMLLFRSFIAQHFFSSPKYAHVVCLSAMATLVGATNTIVSAPTRMQNKRKLYLVMNMVSPLLSYGLSIFLLMAGHYVIALPMASIISGLVMEVTFGIINYKWFDFKMLDSKLLKQMLIIAVPLLPNLLIYWLFNSCDKVMITNMLGVSAAGVYSVGSKLGHCSQLIYTAFAGGWQFFAFSTMKENGQVKANSRIFEYLGIISFVATTFICSWSYSLFKFLFTKLYLGGYIVAPYLFLAPLLQMLFQVISNQFLVIKNTWPCMLILSVGAMINIIANYLLIPLLGIEGASIATLLGYVISDIICVIILCRMKLMVINFKFIFSTCIMVGYMIVWRIFFSDKTFVGTVVAVLVSGILVYMYYEDLKKMINLLRGGKTT